MKSFFLLLLILTFFVSCVKEEDVFEVPFNPTVADSSSTNVASFFANTTNCTGLDLSFTDCFEFVFPLTVASNREEVITITDNNSLIQLLDSQSLSFFITEIQFPFTVINSDNIFIEIDSEIDFIQLSNECEVPTLKDRILTELRNNSCFILEYPVTLLGNSDENNTTINSRDNFIEFLSNQSSSFVLKFEYPLPINGTSNSDILSNNDFVTHTLLKICSLNIPNTPLDELCSNLPELIITQQIVLNNNTILFNVTAGEEELSEISWFSNDELIETNTTEFIEGFTFNSGLQSIRVTAKINNCDTLFESSIVIDTSELNEELDPNNEENILCDRLLFENLTTTDQLNELQFLFAVPENLRTDFTNYKWTINDQEILDITDPFLSINLNEIESTITNSLISISLTANNIECNLTEETHRIFVELP